MCYNYDNVRSPHSSTELERLFPKQLAVSSNLTEDTKKESMIYELHVSLHDSIEEEIDATNETEANLALEMLKKKLFDKIALTKVSSRMHVSSKNFCFEVGSIHLLTYYSKLLPALCVRSHKHYWKDKYEHTFKYLGTGKEITLFEQHPKRVVKKLCSDGGKINKPECVDCVAKFNCYTQKTLE